MISTKAQQVQSSTYNLMLNGLLANNVPTLSVADLNKADTTMVFLDARERREFEVSHIKNAIWVGYDDFDPKRLTDLPKDAKLIVYCAVGYRSEKVTEKLLGDGYSDVSNLYGGIFEWINQGRPVFQTDVATDSVHAYNRVWGIWVNEGKKVYK